MKRPRLRLKLLRRNKTDESKSRSRQEQDRDNLMTITYLSWFPWPLFACLLFIAMADISYLFHFMAGIRIVRDADGPTAQPPEHCFRSSSSVVIRSSAWPPVAPISLSDPAYLGMLYDVCSS